MSAEPSIKPSIKPSTEPRTIRHTLIDPTDADSYVHHVHHIHADAEEPITMTTSPSTATATAPTTAPVTTPTTPVDREPRVWFITGASRGLGRAFAEAALGVGDRVVGAARDVVPLAELVAKHRGRFLALPLDVTDRGAVFRGVDRAVAAFGRLDIVVNNAGAALIGMVEEVTEKQARAHFDVNFFGALWVSQAVLPHLRRQRSGHIVQIGSMGSAVGFASTGLYSAGKAALDSITGAMAMEAAAFGVHVTLVQPGGYETTLFTNGLTLTAENRAYAPLRAELAAMWADSKDADPAKAAAVLLRVVEPAEPPRRIILGGVAYDMVADLDRARREEYERWEALSREGD
ncbi:SDR family NAD(P)-dependent oxidoreductase [Embleya sp. AB8]|uniref:SDR family NAD(P)-dependent oxidoreductase n=1 Tax=Embleya sp. AB8 TaxID=3156304 RepID=UPI003C766F81